MGMAITEIPVPFAQRLKVGLIKLIPLMVRLPLALSLPKGHHERNQLPGVRPELAERLNQNVLKRMAQRIFCLWQTGWRVMFEIVSEW